MTGDHPLPGQDLAGYLRAFTHQMTFGDEDPAVVLDRYYTDDFEHHNDGIRLDRARLIAHARPVRRNVRSCKLDVFDTLIDGDRVAARYAIRAVMRNGHAPTMEVYMFGELAADGRLRRIFSTARQLTDDGPG